MAAQIHPQPVILSATQGLHPQPQNSTGAPGHINMSWSDYSSSPAEAHANAYWEPPVFPGSNHLEAPPGDIYTKPPRALQLMGDLLPIKCEPPTPTSLDAPAPSLAGSSSSVESDSFPAGSRKYKNTRTVSNLTPEQLERKRSNDRRAQRAIRERTKRRMEEYQSVMAQKDEVILALSEKVRALEAELARQSCIQRQGGLGGGSGVGIHEKESDAIQRSNSQSQHPSLTSGLPRNHQGSLASHASGPPSLSYLPSNNRCDPYMTSALASDVAYNAVQQTEDPKQNGMPWPGNACGAISSAPSSSSSRSPPSSMAYGFAGPFSSSPTTMEAGEDRARHPISTPFPPQRIEPLTTTLAHGEGYGGWMPPGSSYWNGEQDPGCGRSSFTPSVQVQYPLPRGSRIEGQVP